MKKTLLGIAVLALSLLAARAALADARYTDPAGDSGGAPDITAVNVTNDAAGNLTFTVTTNQPALAPDAGLSLWFDTDLNGSTGDDGIEYAVFVGDWGWELDRWDGSNYVPVRRGRKRPVHERRFHAQDQQGRSRKRQGVQPSTPSPASSMPPTSRSRETTRRTVRPCTGTSSPRRLAAPPLTLKASAPVAVPAKPVAGKAFSVRVGVTRGDTNAALASGAATCTVKVGLKPLRAVGSGSRRQGDLLHGHPGDSPRKAGQRDDQGDLQERLRHEDVLVPRALSTARGGSSLRGSSRLTRSYRFVPGGGAMNGASST